MTKKEYDRQRYQENRTTILLQRKEYRENNKEQFRKKRKEYYQKNGQKIRQTSKVYRENHKEKNRKYQKEYYNIKIETDINFKLAHSLRVRLRNALKNNYKSGSAVKDLGCSIPQLKTYLESKFQEGISWDNHSYRGWHIDHIVPLSSFDLSNKEEFLKACHFTNLQPLWGEENMRKNKKYEF